MGYAPPDVKYVLSENGLWEQVRKNPEPSKEDYFQAHSRFCAEKRKAETARIQGHFPRLPDALCSAWNLAIFRPYRVRTRRTPEKGQHGQPGACLMASRP